MSEGICTCFDKAIVQSMSKHVTSRNGSLVKTNCWNTAKLLTTFHCKAY